MKQTKLPIFRKKITRSEDGRKIIELNPSRWSKTVRKGRGCRKKFPMFIWRGDIHADEMQVQVKGRMGITIIGNLYGQRAPIHLNASPGSQPFISAVLIQ